eukprot:3210527-Amphidinium_carterae.1
MRHGRSTCKCSILTPSSVNVNVDVVEVEVLGDEVHELIDADVVEDVDVLVLSDVGKLVVLDVVMEYGVFKFEGVLVDVDVVELTVLGGEVHGLVDVDVMEDADVLEDTPP